MKVSVYGYRYAGDKRSEERRSADLSEESSTKAGARELARVYLIGWAHCAQVRVYDDLTGKLLAHVKR